MGVQNLWVLLAPVGRQIEIESLAGKVLAVDASIWLTQFVKAMRDDEGNMIKNAHLIGTFHRVAKLLFYGIKPVFVFDGDTPEIKKRTTARRRRRQENQAANLKQTAQRILINRLKLQREELKRSGGKAAPAVAPNFVLPEQPATVSTASSSPHIATTSNAADSDAAAVALSSDSVNSAETSALDQAIVEAQQHPQSALTDLTGSEDDDETDGLTVDDIALDTSCTDSIDLDAVFALPSHLQKDVVNRILSDRRQAVRDQFIPLAGQPEAYSRTQLAAFLGTTALRRRIEKAQRSTARALVGDAPTSASETAGTTGAAVANLGPGQRIASERDRFFVYKRADESTSSVAVDSVDDSRTTPTTEPSNGTDRVAHREGDNEQLAASDRSYLLLDRLRDKKRAVRDADNIDSVSASAAAQSDLDVTTVKDFAAQAQRQQMRQWAAQSAAAAWIAKHEVTAKSEPTLAIEHARRKRLKREEPLPSATAADSASTAAAARTTSQAAQADAANSICIAFKTDDVVSEHLALFPASLFEPAMAPDAKSVGADNSESALQDDVKGVNSVGVVDGGDDDDDVDWEEVPSSSNTGSSGGVPAFIAPTAGLDVADPPNVVDSSVLRAVAATEGEADDDDDDVEWEDVGSAAPARTSPTLPLSTESSSPRMTAIESEALDSDNDDEVAPTDTLDDSDEMYLTLKSELEDAKAQDDLEELRGEALKSALATASNLTQWAAGAVRRALAAHSLQHKQFVATERALGGYASPSSRASPLRRDASNSTPVRASPLRRSGVSLADAIEIVDAEDTDHKVQHDATTSEVEEQSTAQAAQRVDPTAASDVVADAAAGDALASNVIDRVEDADEQLQHAIAISMRDDVADAPRGSRYLQYATPSPASPLLSSSIQTTTTTPSSQPADTLDVAGLETEQLELKRQRNRQMRDVEGFSDDMVEDVMELLRLFGVPFLVCPMEAEAQCAALEHLGLVDGIITDDSDIFPFGGRRVYKNIFHHQRFVEAFYAADIERELGFRQDELIALALLLGSDYTDGIRGIGIVNATEVVTAYPGVDGLREFKSWVHAFDLAEEAERAATKQRGTKSDDELAALDARARFELTHARARRKWELGDEFPNAHVVRAYTHPQVDRSDARFSWSLPDLAGLRTYTAQMFGWDQLKADGVLLPLVHKASTAATAAAARGGTQTRIDQFFRTYDDEVRYAKIQSKRLRSAVEGRTQRGMSSSRSSAAESVEDTLPAAPATGTPSTSRTAARAKKSTTKATTTKKAATRKKATTLTALGFGQ